MGFMDKAKKMAEQAQAKLDEAQKQFNQGQGAPGGPSSGGPAVEYDQHGRPVPPAPADKTPTIDPNVATSPDPEPAKRHGDPLLNDEPGSRHGTPPAAPSGDSGLSSGDPLAG